jgi:hypothetical protein
VRIAFVHELWMALSLFDPAPGKTFLDLVTAPAHADRADATADGRVAPLLPQQLGQVTR